MGSVRSSNKIASDPENLREISRGTKFGFSICSDLSQTEHAKGVSIYCRGNWVRGFFIKTSVFFVAPPKFRKNFRGPPKFKKKFWGPPISKKNFVAPQN